MNYVMAPISQIGVIPSIGSILGTTGKQELLTSLASQWSGGVVFGQQTDPFADRFHSFLSNIVEPIRNINNQLINAFHSMSSGYVIKEIASEDDLNDIPPDMWVPILTEPEIRYAFSQGKIFGFGLHPDALPEEDVAGRLIYNGSVGWDKLHSEDKEVYFEWDWRSNDPNYTCKELDLLEAARDFIRDAYLADLENIERDPTNPQGGVVIE